MKQHPSFPKLITRREAISAAAVSAAALMAPSLWGADDSEKTAATAKPTLHAYADYGWLRGFSVVPSWGARIEEARWNYDGARMREEVALADFGERRTRLGKPFLVNECIPGSLSDATRAEVARYYTELLAEAGFGWMGWALREGKAISTRRDRFDGNGLHGEGFHPFFTRDGKLRDGLEFLTDQPKRLPPWESK